jgi:8-oxo-dGTP pyrophosphatase MutT (NUDIX family)
MLPSAALTLSRNVMIQPDASVLRVRRSGRVLVFIAMLFIPVQASATTDFTAAGVLLIANETGSTFVFLGIYRYRPWYEMLAGRREFVLDRGAGNGSRRETAYETALRECFEESRGFLKPDYLLGVTDPADFVRDASFVFFRANIEKFSVDEIMHAQIPDAVNPNAYSEIVDYAWVSVEAILSSDDAFVVDDAGRRIQVRGRLKSRLLRARAAGWL